MGYEPQTDFGTPESRSDVAVTLTIGVTADALEQRERVLASFEAYCTVTESVRQGIPVQVSVFDALGARLK